MLVVATALLCTFAGPANPEATTTRYHRNGEYQILQKPRPNEGETAKHFPSAISALLLARGPQEL